MKLAKLSDYKKGWFIGDFSPSLVRISHFEVAVKHHKKGSKWPRHYQRRAMEINCVVRGEMRLDLTKSSFEFVYPGDIFMLMPFEAVKPVFLKDCTVVCIKIPSMPGDKVEC